MARIKNPDFMNGVPELLVLRLLKEREMYGYDLVRAVRHATGNEIALGEGVIYPTLHALESDGYLTTRRFKTGGRTRIYYRLTARGERRLKDSTREWSRVTTAIARCLEGGGNDAPQTI